MSDGVALEIDVNDPGVLLVESCGHFSQRAIRGLDGVMEMN